MKMPTPDVAVLARRNEIIQALRAIVPGEGVIVEQDEMRVYETNQSLRVACRRANWVERTRWSGHSRVTCRSPQGNFTLWERDLPSAWGSNDVGGRCARLPGGRFCWSMAQSS